MLYTGMVSVTFRKLKPEEIVELVSRAGLDAIEWGGDVHVPHGDTDTALRVKEMTGEAGLKVASYGSYYRVGVENDFTFEQALDCTAVLDAPLIRVWAGRGGSAEADEEYWKSAVEDSVRVAGLASNRGIKVAYEYHANTLTDTVDSAVKLLEAVDHPNMGTYWQPPTHEEHEARKQGLGRILKWLDNIHVYHWKEGKRCPLEEGRWLWKEYMDIIKGVDGDRFAMIEFVQNDSPEQFLRDASVLKEICLQGG